MLNTTNVTKISNTATFNINISNTNNIDKCTFDISYFRKSIANTNTSAVDISNTNIPYISNFAKKCLDISILGTKTSSMSNFYTSTSNTSIFGTNIFVLAPSISALLAQIHLF